MLTVLFPGFPEIAPPLVSFCCLFLQGTRTSCFNPIRARLRPLLQVTIFASGDDFPSRPQSSPHNEPVRHLLYGSPKAIQIVIKSLHRLGYTEPNEWSQPMPTERPGEVMCMLTKIVQIE